MSDVVRAAGGILVRTHPGGMEVAIVHRPRYDDWSFPKGKLRAGEAEEAAALREVEEETGHRCRLDRDLGEVDYLDREGRPKVVRYWLMSSRGGVFTPNPEVDELRWVSPDEADLLLSYDHDRSLLRSLEGTP